MTKKVVGGRGRGRPKWMPANWEAARLMVATLVSFGHTQKTIASLLDPPCSEEVLVSNFREQLDSGAVTFKARVEGTLGRLVLGLPEVRRGKRVLQKAVPPDKTLLMFLLKTRYEYRDTPSPLTGIEGLNIASLSDKQLEDLANRLTRAIAKRDSGGAEKANGHPVEQVH